MDASSTIIPDVVETMTSIHHESSEDTTSVYLGNEGKHRLPFLGVGVPKFLLVGNVFLRSPDVHLSSGHDQEAIGFFVLLEKN